MKLIYLFSDGSSLNNPGVGAFATILRYKDSEKIISKSFEYTTNNQMELKGVIEGLKLLKEPCEVHIYTDSSYVVNAINSWLQNWIKKDFKDKKNVSLWKEYIKVSNSHDIKAFWVKGHNGHKENEICDKIANEEARKLKSKLERNSNV